MKNVLKKAIEVLGSFELAAIVLVALCVLTLFGTLEQQYSTLDDVVTKYFDSFFVVHEWAGKYPIPWPGGMLLLPLLGINLLVGGLLRMRMGKSTLGVFVVHLGMVILLFGSLIESSLVTRGFLMLVEGQSDDQFVSYDEYELAIAATTSDGESKLYTIPPEKLDDARGKGRVRFQHGALPFDLVVSHFFDNSRVRRADAGQRGSTVVDGYVLEELDPITKEEKDRKRRNVPGVVITLERPDRDERLSGLLWPGPNALPFSVELDEGLYEMNLRQKRWPLPFRVRLDRFVHEMHPGTRMDKEFSSYVTKTQDGTDREVHITMNEPLRSGGYTLYQSSWGRDGGRYFSVFSVSMNPSDRVPLWSCVIIGLGMLIHFGRKLYLHLKAQSRRDAKLRQDAPAGSST